MSEFDPTQGLPIGRPFVFDLSRGPIQDRVLELIGGLIPDVPVDIQLQLAMAILDELVPEFRNEYWLGFRDGESEAGAYG